MKFPFYENPEGELAVANLFTFPSNIQFLIIIHIRSKNRMFQNYMQEDNN